MVVNETSYHGFILYIVVIIYNCFKFNIFEIVFKYIIVLSLTIF